jgi:hypothetical protein
MQAIAISTGVQPASYKHLGLCIFRPDATHIQVSLLTGQNVGHSALVYRFLLGPRRREVAPGAARLVAIAFTLSMAS